ncbi:hypothetical protein ANCCAN_11615 [Ancylostoma caninum]|uniref:Uncharacterized protein n=1 Tax=Ancylostoma caninum TaxID=29170 RepID=A0A368GDH7_ANCCA|nr:hypothetical protein ANCCAN_11615 [Ancylostoma caninum]
MNYELSQYKRFCAGYFNQWGTFMYVGMKLLLILIFCFATVGLTIEGKEGAYHLAMEVVKRMGTTSCQKENAEEHA